MPELKPTPTADDASLDQAVSRILSGIRIPDLPYPVTQASASEESDWRPLLLSCWNEQREESVIHLLNSVSLNWSVKQVNAAYMADRIMDVFLKTSGLHIVLAQKVARLRFFLAWRFEQASGAVVNDAILGWLDSLVEWRGWSDNGGRASRVLLDQLNDLIIAVAASFDLASAEPVDQFCRQWHQDAESRQARIDKLNQRLLVSETGIARQRQAEQTARAAVGRALKDRRLPPAISQFIKEGWLSLLRQVVLNSGTQGEDWKHASRLLEWLVWLGDSDLSDGNTDRLYQVGEQISDRMSDVWSRVFGAPIPQQRLVEIESVIVSRLRGESPDRQPALADGNFEYDPDWLSRRVPDAESVASVSGKWYVEGSGAAEVRRHFTAWLEASSDVLWTNGLGVKLGTSPWSEFVRQQKDGRLKSLPTAKRFDVILRDTIGSLAAVYDKQRIQRTEAAAAARQQAEALRLRVEAAEAAKRQEIEAKKQELARQQAEEAEKRLKEQEVEAQRERRRQEADAMQQVDGLKLGNWIAVEPTQEGESPVRMKLAVRINATRKLVFVDRLGLNRTEYTEQALVDEVVAGRVRFLTGSADFDDTLSRVVGRIRVGRN